MDYKELSVIFHMSTSAERYSKIDAEAEYRRTMPSSFDIGMDSPYGRMFVAFPRELSVLYEKVLRTERHVSNVMRSVPGIARAALLRGLVLDEVVNTNAVEGIHSTRQQIKEALDSFTADVASEKRFKELARLYLELSKSYREIPETPADVRSIYDRVMEQELSLSKMPDGTIFRAEGVDVTAGGVKVLHKGLEPEERIIEAVENMLNLLYREDMPDVISALASHYVFEYAHPFYDGNGRTGRYLLALFLSEALSMPTALSLSRAIAENLETYYKAFRTAEDPLNRGELTFFVYNMLKLVRIAQTGVIERIERSDEKLKMVTENMDSLIKQFSLSEKEADLLYVLAQYELFGLFGSVSIEECAEGILLKKQMTRKHLASLEDKGLVVRVTVRPAEFALAEKAKEALGVEVSE